MNWIREKDIEDFLNKKDYDIRKSGNGRWIDQKCTPDVISVIADCILEFASSNPTKTSFTINDIWHSEYANQIVDTVFKKPDTEADGAKSEYDKWFAQPMKLFAYAGILNETKSGNSNVYSIDNEELLQYLSMSEMNALKFLYHYNTKVLKDSDIYVFFETFLNTPNPNNYHRLREAYFKFIQKYTKINGDTECGRIFTKVLNPLAFFRNTYGTESGRVSKDKITKDMLVYNRSNFRDIYSGKPKDVTRQDYISTLKVKPKTGYVKYQSSKSKKYLKKFNDAFYGGKSEVDDAYGTGAATQAHHIFPENEFPDISNLLENLIVLTPTQHLTKAHPLNNTFVADIEYQKICLLAKSSKIEENLKGDEENIIYSFDNFKFVLATGLNDESFEDVEDMDFDTINNMIISKYESIN